jgi:hypothetical protein
MEDVVADFRGAVKQLNYDVWFNITYEGTTLVFSPDDRSKRDRNRSMRFFEALRGALEKTY